MKAWKIVLPLAMVVLSEVASAMANPDAPAGFGEQRSSEFKRSDKIACEKRFKQPLGVQFSIEIERICENYTDENLNCAIGVMNEYRIRDYKPALKVCVMKYNEPSLQRCVIGKMGEQIKAGREVQIPLLEDECRHPTSSVEAMRPAPQRRVPSAAITQLPNSSSNACLEGDFRERELRNQIAVWLNIDANKIFNLEVQNYYSGLSRWAESIALMLSRPVRLYRVSFTAAQARVECTGTDFAPMAKYPRNTYLALHECTVDGRIISLEEQFDTRLNYSFIEGLPANFRAYMREVGQKWKGDGNISFRREDSDFLVMRVDDKCENYDPPFFRGKAPVL